MADGGAAAVFDRHAREYDALRRRLVPSFDAFYGAALEALSLAGRPLVRVLDLGAGTGLLAAMVVAAHPGARVTLLDGAPGMLEEARRRLGDEAEYVVGDLGDEPPGGPWDAIVSALAIHHLDDAGKRALFARAFAALAPGGVLVDAEQVLGPTPALDAAYLERHRRAALALGASEGGWEAALARMEHDRCATVEDQLAWLRDAGFADVDAPWRDGRFAVLAGRRA
jgi:tRNA (cmo5U34)-methyltransferase